VNGRALELTAANARRAGVAERVTPVAPDDVDADRCYDRILSNPPIRVGKSALRSMLTLWLDRLRPTGRAHLVVQRHLGADSLAAWLDDRGHRVERLRSRAGFRLLEVGPRADSAEVGPRAESADPRP